MRLLLPVRANLHGAAYKDILYMLNVGAIVWKGPHVGMLSFPNDCTGDVKEKSSAASWDL